LDTAHSALFYVLAAVAIAGAFVAALGRGRSVIPGLGALGVAASLLLADLSAGFAALVVFVLLLGGAAVAIAVPEKDDRASDRLHQAGALAAVIVFAALAYAAYRGSFHSPGYPGGSFDASALGRHLLAHDPLALLATAAAVLIGTGFGAASLVRRRDR
jgi:hypothetical protein